MGGRTGLKNAAIGAVVNCQATTVRIGTCVRTPFESAQIPVQIRCSPINKERFQGPAWRIPGIYVRIAYPEEVLWDTSATVE